MRLFLGLLHLHWLQQPLGSWSLVFSLYLSLLIFLLLVIPSYTPLTLPSTSTPKLCAPESTPIVKCLYYSLSKALPLEKIIFSLSEHFLTVFPYFYKSITSKDIKRIYSSCLPPVPYSTQLLCWPSCLCGLSICLPIQPLSTTQCQQPCSLYLMLWIESSTASIDYLVSSVD